MRQNRHPNLRQKKRRHRQTARARVNAAFSTQHSSRRKTYISRKKSLFGFRLLFPALQNPSKLAKLPFPKRGANIQSGTFPRRQKKPIPSSRRQRRQTQKRGRPKSGDPCGGPLFQQTLKALAAGNFSLRKVAKRGHYGKLHIELFKHSANPNCLQTRADSSI